jgi:hypothetical protein
VPQRPEADLTNDERVGSGDGLSTKADGNDGERYKEEREIRKKKNTGTRTVHLRSGPLTTARRGKGMAVPAKSRRGFLRLAGRTTRRHFSVGWSSGGESDTIRT